MNKRIRVPMCGVLLALAAFGRDEYTRSFDKTVTLHPGERVSIEHSFGSITIKTHPGPEAVIHADIKASAGDTDRAKAFADDIEILVEPGASELNIRTRYPGGHVNWYHNASYTVHYEITIPETAPLSVRNSFGSVSVAGMKANSEITSSHGSIEFRDGRGTQRLENSFASVKVANNVGDVEIDGSYGSVAASDITGALTVRNRFASVTAERISKGASIHSGNGTVSLTDIGGETDVRTSFGSVKANGINGPLRIENSYGAIHASGARGAEVTTSFAPIMLYQVSGPIHVTNQNGAIEVKTAPGPCQPIVIRTSFSTMRVMLPGDASYRVTAHTSFAHIHTDFPLTVSGSLSTDNLSGVIGGGSCEMTLTDSYGAIDILKGGG